MSANYCVNLCLKFLYNPNILSTANTIPNIRYSNTRSISFHPIKDIGAAPCYGRTPDCCIASVDCLLFIIWLKSFFRRPYTSTSSYLSHLKTSCFKVPSYFNPTFSFPFPDALFLLITGAQIRFRFSTLKPNSRILLEASVANPFPQKFLPIQYANSPLLWILSTRIVIVPISFIPLFNITANG